MNYKSAQNHAYLLNSKFLRKLCFAKTCIIRAVTRNIHMQQVILSATSHVFKLITLYIKIIHRFQVYRQTLWEKAVLEKNELSWTSVTLYVSSHKIRDASNISKYRLLQRWNRFIHAFNPWKYQRRTATTDMWEKREKGIKCSSCQLESYRMTQVRWNKRTHPIRTLSRNNNTTTGLKRGPNPLSGVLIPRPWEVIILSLLSMSPSSPQATERS